MNRRISTSPLRRGLLRGSAAALATVLLGFGAVAPAHAEPVEHEPAAAGVEVTGGSVQWIVRSTIRNYLENFGHTEGYVDAAQGASYTRGAPHIEFPVQSGSVDPEAGTASLRVGGEVEMRGFGEAWLHFEDIRLDIADERITVTVDMIESYNVKTRTDDLVLSTFDLPEGGLTIEDDELQLTTERGAFPDVVALEHLPSYGGPTYAHPNNWTDPLSLHLTFGEGGGEDPGGEDPGGNPGGEDPATGPYGASTGTPYPDTTATIRVTPGYAIAPDGSTPVKIEGFGFDPGPAVAPGTGSGGIYVGLGTMKDFGNPEKWRRSKGGSSGPVGMGDYTYGAPMFVGNQGSGDADVADAVMNASGYWSYTMTIPGKDIPSFFGDTIDCVALQCGFFSFGAHGAVKAANEAFTPIFFEGQDETGWPDRDTGEEPTPVDPITPDKPSSDPSTLPGESGLTGANRGGVTVEVSGGQARLTVGSAYQNTWVGAVVYSDPEFAGWYLVPANGRVTVPLPSGLAAGDHRIAAIDADENLIGWAPFTIEEQKPAPSDGTKDPHGTSTGKNDLGASLTVAPAYSLNDRDQKVTVTGSGYATDNNGDTAGGAYILFGWVDKMPSQGGSMSAGDYVYADGQETYQWMVSYPGSSTQPGTPVMTADGDWETEFTLYGSEFTSANGVTVDCYEVQCGVFTIGAHGKVNAGVEVFAPVYFDADGSSVDPTAKPPVQTPPPPSANPNALPAGQGQNAGVGVNGGLIAAVAQPSEARTLMIAGLLIVSVGLLGAALLRSRRTSETPLPAAG
ncbi:HtaA domain-containing protein [Leucobacter sp.]